LEEFKMTFEEIKIQQVISKLVNAKCNCGNNQWIEEAIEISPIIAGNMLLGYSFEMRLFCTQCKLRVNKDIGNFNERIQEIDLDTIFCMSNEEMIKRFKELKIKTDLVQEKFKKLSEGYL